MKGTGETAAIYGYNKQYEIFANEIYNSLLNNNFEWVEFASSDAGKLDDVLISGKNELKAFQVKDIATNLTYSKFTKSSTESIFEGCFKGWESLKTIYPDKKIIAKYISNEKASNNDKIEGITTSRDVSFNDFIKDFWEKIRLEDINENSIPSEWRNVFDELKNIVNTTDSRLVEFIQSFEFVLEDKHKSNTYSYNLHREKDVEKISKHIFKIIGTKGKVKFDKNKFLMEFDLLSRYETHFRHSFFVDETHYQPITETISSLESVINNSKNGYIALIGNAGSGKSTLLTKWIKDRKERVLRYYAYVNKEMNNEFGYRGEATIFLKDLLVQIREKQFSVQENLPPEDILELQKQFHKELDNLKYENRKVFIIVDGLDHIEREQNVTKSLIDILPNPEQIPENIYFILGSRTTKNLENLNERIKLHLEEKGRTITINPFSVLQIQNLLKSNNILLTQKQLSELHKNTQGHPLFLRYTIEEILVSDPSDYDKLINSKNFKGDIYEEYKIFWNKNKLEDNFIDLLGIISRFRHSYIDITLLPKFVSTRSEWNKIEKISEHFFFKKGNIWLFFHNSFKEFLKEQTAKNFITEQYEEQINIDFHKKIYNAIKDLNNDYSWNILYHLFEAKEYRELINIATQDFFRKQWFGYRNHKYIVEDIKLAAIASYKENTSLKLFSYFLSHSELYQRNFNFNLGHHYKAFHQLNKIDIANSFIFDNTEIFVSNDKVLDYSLDLYKKGSIDLSLELLKKAEPTYILNINQEVSPHRYDREEMAEIDEIELIVNWAKVSSLHYPIEEIIHKVKGISVIPDRHEGRRERNLLQEVIEGLTDLYIELENWEKLNDLYESVLKIPNIPLFYFYFDIVWNLDNNNELYETALKELSNWKNTKNNPINRRLCLLETFINNNVYKGKKIFDKLISPVTIEKDDFHLESYLNYIFDYSRLYYITTKDFSLDSATFISKNKKEIVSSFYSEFAELGKSYAYLHYGYNDAAKGFISRLKNILSYFHYSVTDYQYEYNIQENKSNLIILILRVSSRISKDFLNQVLNQVSFEWKENQRYWRNNQKQSIIEFVITIGLNNDWVIDELNNIDNDFLIGDQYSIIENGVKQIELWSLINKVNKGETVLNKLMEISLDVRYEKDYQLNYIIDWFLKNKNVEADEIAFYLKCLNSIAYRSNSAADYPAKKILEAVLPFGNGFEIFKHLLFEGLVNFNDGVEIILSYLLKNIPEKQTLIIKLFTRIVLNFDNNYYPRTSFLDELFKKDILRDDLQFLVKEMNIYSIYEQRNSYLNRIVEYVEKNNIKNHSLNYSYTPYTKKDSKNDDYSLKLKDGKILNEEEVLEKINSYQDILNLIGKENYDSYFEWSKPIIKIIDTLNTEELSEILDKKKFKSTELIQIANSLYENKKEPEFIDRILDNISKKSTQYSWNKNYDGGSKIKFYKFLKEFNSTNKINDLAFKDFVDSTDSWELNLLDNMNEILSLIDEDFNYDKYYEELKLYKNELLKSHYENSDIPNVNGKISESDFLLSLIIFLIEFPSDFDEIIFEILIQELDQNRELVIAVLNTLYEKQYQLEFIKLLAGISLSNLEFVKNYLDEIIELLNNQNFETHCIAVRVLKRLNVDYKSLFKPLATNIPFTYTIEIDYKPSLIISEEERINRINKTGYLRETKDPLEYCNLYIYQIKLLSEETGFQIVNIANRIISLGDKNYKQPSWYENLSDKEIRNIYENRLELKISYKRPRYQKVWFGLMLVLKELWELGLIDRGLANYISNSFDENTYYVETNPKPSFIPTIIQKGDYVPSADEKWVYELSKEYLKNSLKLKDDKGWLILAENTIIEGQGDGHVQELRQSFLDVSPSSNLNQEIIYETSLSEYISQYKNIEVNGLCFYNWKLTVNIKRNWLAFNPYIAQKMGLKFSNEGVFRWVNEKNITVIESIYWRNNDTRNKSRNLHSECGYGWYVVISPEGLELLKKIGYIPKYHHQKISRDLRFIQNRYNTDIEEKNNIIQILEVNI